MSNVLNSLFGGKPADPAAHKGADSDFGDFSKGAAADSAPVTPRVNTFGGPPQTIRPYTKWYRVHERYSLSDFQIEGGILAVIAVALLLHLFGARRNRSKAHRWIRAHTPTLTSQFALVGFAGVPPAAADKSGDELVQFLADTNAHQGDDLIREKSLFEFATYATGRSNVAFVDVKLTLKKRFNPLTLFIETALGFFFETFASQTTNDVAEATLYPFDGREAQVIPGPPGAAEVAARTRSATAKSTYDDFVWAVVHKERMKQVRDDRYDVSLTSTKDNAKLPSWLTVMTESAEITELLLTPELIEAATAAGDLFEYFIISDQPLEKPTTLDETKPSKRIFLKYRLPSDDNYEPLVPLFKYFVRVTDQLAQHAHFRPEVQRKVKAVREDAIRLIKKADEEKQAEERAAERERAKKAKRDQELNAMDAKKQKKFLEKEREKELRKSTKKQTTKAR